MRFSSEFLLKALDLPQDKDPQVSFDRIWTDSRTIEPCDFFVPVKGDKFDGHDFIPDALERGVKGFLIQEDYERRLPEDTFVIRVPNVLEAFRQIAAVWRNQFSIPVIAIAGSVGKTTVKEMLAALFSSKFRTAKTLASQNGYLGIPMTVLNWQKDTEIAVVEIGIDDKGAMKEHLELVRPTYGVVTALGPEHLEKLESVETATEEEVGLFSFLARTQGWSFWSLDEALLKEREIPKDAFTFSMENRDADYFGQTQDRHLEINAPDKKIRVPLMLPGPHNARNLLAASVVAHSLGVAEDEMMLGLGRFKNPENRLQIEPVENGIHYISDYYNANPTSMEAAFKVLETDFQKNPKVLVLGDMLELGALEEMYHRGLASEIENASPKSVYLTGPKMKWLKDELDKKAVSFPVGYFDSKEELSKELLSGIGKGDVVLIKGSRGMRMEEIAVRSTQHAVRSS